MNPGLLDTLLDVQTVTRTRDAVGGWAESWATSTTEWAQVRPVTGREYLGATQERAEITETIIMRYRALNARDNRLKNGSLIYDIQHIAVRGRNASLEILVKRRAA
jgi:SPP1 family predicted phage head-tail adaptor